MKQSTRKAVGLGVATLAMELAISTTGIAAPKPFGTAPFDAGVAGKNCSPPALIDQTFCDTEVRVDPQSGEVTTRAAVGYELAGSGHRVAHAWAGVVATYRLTKPAAGLVGSVGFESPPCAHESSTNGPVPLWQFDLLQYATGSSGEPLNPKRAIAYLTVCVTRPDGSEVGQCNPATDEPKGNGSLDGLAHDTNNFNYPLACENNQSYMAESGVELSPSIPGGKLPAGEYTVTGYVHTKALIGSEQLPVVQSGLAEASWATKLRLDATSW